MFRPFRKARAFTRKLKLKNQKEWFAFAKGRMPRLGRLPADIPAAAELIYADKGWTTWGDWLGTGIVASYLRVYRPFREARTFARKLRLKSQSEWFAFTKARMLHLGRLPPDIPATPWLTYTDKGWTTLGDWLGTGTVAARLRIYRPFRDARAFARKLKLKSQSEWFGFTRGKMLHLGRLPADIPATPGRSYAEKGWTNWGDWLGTGTIAPRLRTYRPFREARAFAHKLKLKSRREWFAFAKGKMPQLGRIPSDIPVTPERTYRDQGWKGVGDWLGTGTIAPFLRKYRPFSEARTFTCKLKLRSSTEWNDFVQGHVPRLGKLPEDIPAAPNNTYAGKGWNGMGDWLGTGRIADQFKVFRSFRKARAFVRKLKLKNHLEWIAFTHGRMPRLGRLLRIFQQTPIRLMLIKVGRLGGTG